MKKWEEPKFSTLGLESTKQHICDITGDLCPDYNGEHAKAGHSTPAWSVSHGHTHCCAGPDIPVS